MLGSKVTKGSRRVNQRLNYLRISYGHQIWYEEPLTRVEYYAGVKGHIEVMWGTRGQNYLGIPYGSHIWSEEPLTRVEHNAVVKGHIGVIKSQPEVKLVRNTLWPPNLVRKTPDQSGRYCCGQRSHMGHVGLTKVIFRNTLLPPDLIRTPDQSEKQCWGQRSHRGHAGSTRGLIA